MYTLQQHLKYNLWATEILADMLTNLSEEQWEQELISSFPTIKLTVYHIWDAQSIWLYRIKGGEVAVWPSTQFTGSKAECIAGFVQSAQNLVEFFADKDSAFLETKLHYKNMKMMEYTTPIEEIMFHTVNHATHHRGQIYTMLRQVGFTQLENSDLITYVRSLNTVTT